MKNVCKETYAMGIIFEVIIPQNPPGETQVEVLWRNMPHALRYAESQLEVISESR
jgi:hypothetical protein